MPPVSAGGMTCPDCDGRGHGLVYPENKCGFCGGTGHVLRDHE
jgi:DnaJ-class molecular chaperone